MNEKISNGGKALQSKPVTGATTIRRLFLVLPFLVTLSSVAEIRAQTYFYDLAGRLTQVAYRQGNGVRYTYDDADNLVGVSRINLPAPPGGLVVTRVSEPCVLLTWEDLSGSETGFVVMRRSVAGYAWEDIATLGPNLTQYQDCDLSPFTSYVYRVSALGIEGRSAYSDELDPEDASSLHVVLDSGQVVTGFTANGAGGSRIGYAVLDAHYGEEPYGTAVFSLTQNGVVVSEVGVPASPPTRRSRIYIDFRTGVSGGHFNGTIAVNTGIAVVNRGAGAANVTYTLRNLGGAVISVGSGVLGSGVHFAKFVDEIRDVAPGFVVPPDFPTATRFGSLEVESDQPLSILALRLTLNQRAEALLTSTPVADLNQPTVSGSLYFPQFADGGGFVSSIVLLSASNALQEGTIDIFANDGSPLPVRQLDGPVASSFQYSIPPRGGFVLQTAGSGATPDVGWAVLTPGSGQAAPIGAGLFQLAIGGVVVTESGVPSALSTTHARVYVDLSGGHNTGLAIANPHPGQTTLTARIFQTDGETPIGSGLGPLVLAGRGHSASFVNELVSDLPAGFTGVLDIRASTPFVALTLRSLTNARQDFLLTTFPVADLTRPAPSPVVFPQIADGGGISSEFILLSAGGASGSTIYFVGEDGSPLFIGAR